jgi:hypothetical protein
MARRPDPARIEGARRDATRYRLIRCPPMRASMGNVAI